MQAQTGVSSENIGPRGGGPEKWSAWRARAAAVFDPARWRANAVDGVLVLGALLFGSVSLLYPFGGDQGLYAYVGQEWLHGALPYRDAMEQKTPLVFLLHALLVLVSGANMWAIRAAELAWVLFVGVIVAELARTSDEPRRPGVVGVACFSTSVLYFGLFDYWDTAQCEIWYAGLTLCALRVVTRGAARRRTWLLGGAFAGLAVLMKPPAVFLTLVVAAVVVARVARAARGGLRPRAALAALSLLAAGAAGPLVATAAYFVAGGAFEHLIDQALHANYHDMLHSSSVSSVADVALRIGEFVARLGPLAYCTLGALVLGLGTALRARGDGWTRYGVAIALLASGLAAVVVQRKFYAYHWGALAPLLAYPLVCVAADLGRRRGRSRSERWALASAPLLLAAGLLVAFSASDPARAHFETSALAARYLAGHVDRARFLVPFVRDGNTPYAEQETVGHWIAARSVPDDLVAVRGFEQTIYRVARRRAPTRFFWTRWLTEPRRAYRRREWLAEDEAALRQRPPRYVVVNARARKGPASRRYFEPLGYAQVFRHGRLIVLERKGRAF